MSLIDEVKDEVRGSPRCAVAKLLEKHPEIADELAETLADTSLPGSAISRALINRYGVDGPRDQMLNRHRDGRCSCR